MELFPPYPGHSAEFQAGRDGRENGTQVSHPCVKLRSPSRDLPAPADFLGVPTAAPCLLSGPAVVLRGRDGLAPCSLMEKIRDWKFGSAFCHWPPSPTGPCGHRTWSTLGSMAEEQEGRCWLL